MSELRRPYAAAPRMFEITVSNAGSDRVTELTLGWFERARQFFQPVEVLPCSDDLRDYEGLKRFAVDLAPGDSVKLVGDVPEKLLQFCIVRAFGPPVGLR